MKERGNTIQVFKIAKHFKYVLIGEGVLVGACAGLVAVVYRIILSYAEEFVSFMTDFVHTGWTHIVFWFIILMILGVIIAGLVKKEPFISGSGIPQVEAEMLSFIDQKWYRVLLYKAMGGTLCAFGGLSLGREGPSIQLGAMAGKGISHLFHRVKMEERLLLTCGAAAGLSAAFNAPLAGVMFALEEIHKNFNASVLVSVMCASVTGDFISRNIFGLKPVFQFEILQSFPLHDYWLLLVLGVLCGIFGVFYNSATLFVQKMFAKTKLLHYGVLIPLFLSGIFTFYYSDVLGSGHHMIEMLEEQPIRLFPGLFVLFVIKFLYSLVSFGSGAPGGIFFPMLVLGSFCGAIFGNIWIQYFGFEADFINNFIVLAMAATFTSIVRAPITGIILIAEMSGTLTNLLPIAVVSLVAYVSAVFFNSEPIYESLLHKLLIKNGVDISAFRGEKRLEEYVVELGSMVCDCKVKDIDWPKKCLLVSIERQGKELIPKGDTMIRTSDKLIVLFKDEDGPYVQHQLEKCCRKM